MKNKVTTVTMTRNTSKTTTTAAIDLFEELGAGCGAKITELQDVELIK